jgi:hypothetical protein
MNRMVIGSPLLSERDVSAMGRLLKLEGRTRGEIATCSGTAEQAPGLTFSANAHTLSRGSIVAEGGGYLPTHAFRRREVAKGPRPLASFRVTSWSLSAIQ